MCTHILCLTEYSRIHQQITHTYIKCIDEQQAAVFWRYREWSFMCAYLSLQTKGYADWYWVTMVMQWWQMSLFIDIPVCSSCIVCSSQFCHDFLCTAFISLSDPCINCYWSYAALEQLNKTGLGRLIRTNGVSIQYCSMFWSNLLI